MRVALLRFGPRDQGDVLLCEYDGFLLLFLASVSAPWLMAHIFHPGRRVPEPCFHLFNRRVPVRGFS